MSKSTHLIDLSPEKFVHVLKKEKINRFFFVYDFQKNKIKSSHDKLQPLADFLMQDRRDFTQHEGLFFQVTKRYKTLQGAFIHKTNRGQGAGGLRYWQYNTVKDFLLDGLRLSKGMTRKNALAGLYWGGGKGAMVQCPNIKSNDPKIRSYLFREFGKFVTSLGGCYITAEDVGTAVSDMANVFSKTRFITCIPREFGGSGNPSRSTARGVIAGMEAALAFIGAKGLKGKTVAVQGMGNVGSHLIRLLFENHVKKVIACDINANNVAQLKKAFSGKNLIAHHTTLDDISILKTTCDILAPCSTGAVINSNTIPHIRANIICGAANNQLEDARRDDKALHDRRIIYIPDFLTNRMGIVNCANEQYGYVSNDSFIEQHLSKDWEYSIYKTIHNVLKESQQTGKPPSLVAIKLADKLSEKNHPIFGHRGKEIIASLVANNWHEST